jgi:tetratricopeptide (TPR) repeat protein
MKADAPKKISKYDVVDLIGRGGMGVVYKAVDRALGRLVAIKMVTSAAAEQGELLKRFYREAQFTANLRHPNIVTVYSLGDFKGRPYLVMEYLNGKSLESILTMKPVTLLQKISYVRQVCNGLEYAHSHQPSIIHRDIKPANIVVLEDGTVKIVDFGLARLTHTRNTRVGQLMGSFHYMSPEQVKGVDLDGRSDIFSTGVVLYRLLTRKLPFEGSGIGQTLNKILTSPAPPLGRFLTEYPATLGHIVARALAKNRDERYQSASEFSSDLLEIEEQLKSSLFDECISRAQGLLRCCEFDSAQQELLKILRVDRQHVRANDLMRKVVQAIAKTQGEPVGALRARAEQALEQNQFAEAVNRLQQAIRLDDENVELQSCREQVLASHARAQKLNQLLSHAGRAYAAPDLEGASPAVDEALKLDPDTRRAKAVIARKVAAGEKERRPQELLTPACLQTSPGRFTDALAVPRKAESLVAAASGIRSLMVPAVSSHEQELRRKSREAAGAEITGALGRSDPPLALKLAETGLRKFPSERSPLQLKTRSEGQIEHQLWATEQAGLPGAREQREIGAAKSKATAAIWAALSAGEFDAAERQLNSARRDLGDSVELRELKQYIHGQRAGSMQKKMEGLHKVASKPSPAPSGPITTAVLGSSSSPAALGGTELRDGNVMKLTPREGIVLAEPTPPQVLATDLTSSSSAVKAPETTSSHGAAYGPPRATVSREVALRMVEKQLATVLGPLARIVVKKAASRTTDLEELYTLVAASLERESDRRAFLARKPGVTRSWAKNQPMQEPSPPDRSVARASAGAQLALTPAAIDRAARMLAHHVGPISGVVARRAAQRADSLRTLYRLLAQHVESKTERDCFLRDAGFAD